MGKLDEIRQFHENIVESMGASRPRAAVNQSDAVIPPPTPASSRDRLDGLARSKNAAEIPLDRIEPDPDQPREEFDEESLQRLAESLKTKGQLQPIRVRWDESRMVYVIICGERRWRAAKLAGLATITAMIVDGPIDPAELLAFQLIENCLRDDLRPIEQARALKQLMDRNEWSTRQLARELALSQSHVVRALTLLELPIEVQEQVEQGALPASTAAEIAKLDNPADQAEVAARVVGEKLTRDQVVDAVKTRTGRKAPMMRAEFQADGGWKVVATGPEGATPEQLVAVLRQVLKQAQAAARVGARDQAA
jgi:ParB family transcriptional regulator, chromosome partitioning protein